jgi:hypothetical protein
MVCSSMIITPIFMTLCKLIQKLLRGIHTYIMIPKAFPFLWNNKGRLQNKTVPFHHSKLRSCGTQKYLHLCKYHVIPLLL